jgi:sensor histidine kinase YesM
MIRRLTKQQYLTKFLTIKALFKRIPLFWLLQLGGWAGWGVVYFATDFPFQTPDIRFAHAVNFVGTFVASFVMHSVCRRQWQAGLRFPRTVLVVLGWCAGLAYFIATTFLIARQIYTHRLIPWNRLPYLMENLPGMGHPGFTLLFWSAVYFGIKYYQAMEAERRRSLEAERSAREAELRALRYQVNPHFLFNTLNAISTLVLAVETEAATTMIARLGDFLRATLDGKSTYEVPLSEELFLTEQYLAIEKVRMGDNLQIKMNVDASIADCLVPHLILQPLVENSIRHGLVPRPGIGHLIIEAERVNEKVVIKVNDDGIGKTLRPVGTNGNGQRIGLANVERRLKELYGEHGRFNLSWPLAGGCNVLLEIPYRPAESDHEIQSSYR